MCTENEAEILIAKFERIVAKMEQSKPGKGFADHVKSVGLGREYDIAKRDLVKALTTKVR